MSRPPLHRHKAWATEIRLNPSPFVPQPKAVAHHILPFVVALPYSTEL